MKFKLFYCLIITVLLSSCSNLFKTYDDQEDFREDSGSGIQINSGSLVGQWQETHTWETFGGEAPSSWSPININYSDTYTFLDDGTFTSNKDITDCASSNGTYLVEEKKIILTYICETQPIITKEILIDEFFFREDYIVFIEGDYYDNISKFELIN
ncbi:hypothetical protein [uncultured Polaribacter sp.]|uniref:hypothetical protein n=1 Tax=uncultured Polaribacter sp. TaxID=174711 RepID=UPI00260B2D36|nr:hypothetical protein [uncultured Polaribacter sp.]